MQVKSVKMRTAIFLAIFVSLLVALALILNCKINSNVASTNDDEGHHVENQDGLRHVDPESGFGHPWGGKC